MRTRVNLTALGLSAAVLAACVGLGKAPEKTSGADDYANYCAACHGASGKGDGEAAAGLAKKPADLSKLAARNKGAFPTTKVMAQIWGYAGKKGEGVMPDFAPLLEGDTVPYDGGDGIATPTPIRLVELAEYLKTLQVK
ncbi:MAG: c-type cytochrome [Cypionkella sp.]|uniref:c-type cytochrome n=1 Tax=Cypionkella sp. TaxID=2811411 RepID=UPI00263940AA|nr:c-type cytochrome [Cypionkella sp.]MDB5660061.1 c-type cytochrome [Cypionkella sp.]